MADRTTKFPNGLDSAIIKVSNAVEKTAAYTVVANTDAGKTFYITGGAVTFTLPSIEVGETYKFVNMNKDGVALTISPAALDGISLGTATDDKDLINTAATAKKGDYVVLASLDQVVAWQVTDIGGIWAKEA